MALILTRLFLTTSLVLLAGCTMSNAPDENQTDDVISHWTFDECKALDSDRCTVEDASDISYSVEVYGADVKPGQKGGAISFNGIGDFGLIAHNDVFNAPIKTYQFWFSKTNETNSDSPGLVDIEGLIFKSDDTGLDRAILVNLRGSVSPFDLVFTVGVGTDSLARVEQTQVIVPMSGITSLPSLARPKCACI